MSKRDLRRDIGDDPEAGSGLDAVFAGYGMSDGARELAARLEAIQPAAHGAAPRTLEDGSVQIAGLRFTLVGLHFDAPVSRQGWQTIGQFFRQTRRAMQWWIGDWINAAPAEWGETYRLAVESTGLKESYLRNVASVAGRVDPSLRSDKLTFSHYQELISRAPPDAWPAWIARAIAERMSRRQLVAAIEATARPSPAERHPLTSREHSRRFARVWRALSRDIAPSLDDVCALERWARELREALEVPDPTDEPV